MGAMYMKTPQREAAKPTLAGRDWGMFAAGAALVLMGFAVLVFPGLTLVTLATMAGAMFLVSGAFGIVTFARFRKELVGAGWVLLNAACNIVLGLVFLLHPLITATVIPWLAGAFVIAYGVFACVAAFKLRKLGSSWGLMLANGIVSLLCGVVFVVLPDVFALFLGMLLIMRGVTMAAYGVASPARS